MSVWPRLEPLLAQVQKPARYIGCEDGAQSPSHDPAKVAWLLAYPDTCEIGLPSQALQILYEILNERSDAIAERTYAPWTDLEVLLRTHDVPLFSVDTREPRRAFHLLAFNLSAELTYTNLLNMVDLAGVPVRSADRTGTDLLIAAGGHCTYSPGPFADLLDFVFLGAGEEVVSEITEAVAAWKHADDPAVHRDDALDTLAQIPGVHVPSRYEPISDGDELVEVAPRSALVPEQVEKRTIADL